MKIIPFNDRILVKRRKVGSKIGKEGIIHAPDSIKEGNTDLADVVEVPEHTFADEQLLKNAEAIFTAMTEKASKGDSDALVSLLRLNDFVKIKTLKIGDGVMIGKYVGTTFNTSDSTEELTIVLESEIIGVLRDD